VKLHAVADIHYPRFQELFETALEGLESPDLLLLAGDVVNRGSAEEYPRVLDIIHDHLGSSFPIVGCFGNEEYSEVREEILGLVGKKMSLLDEKAKVVEIQGVRIGIVGTQGSLDKPTTWQRQNMPSIKRVFEQRANRAANLLGRLKEKSDYRILLMHYSPCIETCEGEDKRDFSWLGSRKFYSVVQAQQPDLVVHGHVHNAVIHRALIGTTIVQNVALPAVQAITQLELDFTSVRAQ
jgi:Icc-related predicted phosphoesterase